MSDIYLNVDGAPTPIEQCIWFGVDGCGCTSSAVAADKETLTAEDARLFVADGKKQAAAKDRRKYVLAARDTEKCAQLFTQMSSEWRSQCLVHGSTIR